jgi:hypothetical protein
MGWEALTAIGSIAAAVILLVGSFAAIVQLRHLRQANQIESYVALMERLASPEMIEARSYVESEDFTDREKLAKHFELGLDHRILLIGAFYQNVARLINYGILDRELFLGFTNSAFVVWKAIQPIAYELRARHPENPRWMDIEYLVYSSHRDKTFARAANHYSAAFRERVGLADFASRAQQMSSEASTAIRHAP